MRLIDADAFRDYVLGGKPIGLTICEYSESDILSMIRQQPTITQPPNDPLTLEELQEMDGEPVWLHTFSAVQKKTQIACWAILECSSTANAVFLRAGVNSRSTKWFCNYGERWLAYRRKPEEGTT